MKVTGKEENCETIERENKRIQKKTGQSEAVCGKRRMKYEVSVL